MQPTWYDFHFYINGWNDKLINLFAGKVDLNRLLRFDSDLSLYLYPLPPPDPLEPVTTHTTSPQDNSEKLFRDRGAIEDELVSLLTRFTRFSHWPSDLTLLELGVTSFDIVRIADAVTDRLSGCHEVPSLTHTLLTRSLREISDFLWEELSEDGDCDGDVIGDGDVRVVGDGEGERRGGIITPSQKRVRRDVDIIPSSKRVLVASPSVPIHAWRRGQYYFNGK